LPVNFSIQDKIISAKVKINEYNKIKKEERPNVYFRFFIKPKTPYISIRKSGINKSTIIYDIKINEQRNIPEELIEDFREKSLCKIRYCFSFNILPNKYDIVFFDSSSLQNVRSLEYDSFNKYLGKYIGGKSFKKDELLVVFNKKEVKEYEEDVSKSFSFFSISFINCKESLMSFQIFTLRRLCVLEESLVRRFCSLGYKKELS
jgi:hypothetical protein